MRSIDDKAIGLVEPAEAAMDRHEGGRGHEPATLHKVMREAIGFGLRRRYEPDQEIPHEQLVLIMQMNENGRRRQGQG